MANYTQDRYAGPPKSGPYRAGDTVTDSNSVVWECVADGNPGIWTYSSDAAIDAVADDIAGFTAPFIGINADDNGFADDATADEFTLAATEPGDGMAHPVTITYAGAEDLSLITVTLVGTGAAGALTEDVALPDGAATVTSEGLFLTLTSATPDATIGAETVDIGWGSIRPEASAELRGKIRVEATVGATDKVLICIDTAGDGTFEWVEATVS